MLWTALWTCSAIRTQSEKKRFKYQILRRQKFTKQTHQEYLHYEYSKFRLGFEFIKVMRFDAFWHVLTCSDAFWSVLMHFDMFWCILTCFDALWRVLTYFDLCHEELWKKCSTIWIQAERKRFKCPNCGKFYVDKSSLNKHIKNTCTMNTQSSD